MISTKWPAIMGLHLEQILAAIMCVRNARKDMRAIIANSKFLRLKKMEQTILILCCIVTVAAMDIMANHSKLVHIVWNVHATVVHAMQ